MRWDELTPRDFLAAREKAKGVCVLPVACVERHGSHLPLGTDAFMAEGVCRRATGKESFLWFPVLRLGVNGEAAANPGAIALRTETILSLLENLCEEFARNGFGKIILYSSHGGNRFILPLFVQQAKVKPIDYIPYYFFIGGGLQRARPKSIPADTPRPGGHAGIYETAGVMAAAPGTVKMDQSLPDACAEKLDRLKALDDAGVYTPVSYYANFPYHYAAVPEGASVEVGEEVLDACAEDLARAVRAVKEDEATPAIWREFLARMKRGGTMEPGEVDG